ncbi:hypothetical protein HMPREF0299_7315 [Corynebacterium matruchotii ATCC 14266]|uniref:Uncharacterized protein n=1 Tax=Corynebacterium matruchotii ATCC 14266 TaxID=553207 RepID=E0DEB9_9CORY|nr:hypothetical protein HMPREF0299_7315 [Corynebacterium matruchotii ATCC 14266]
MLLPTRTYLHKSHNLSTSVFLPTFFGTYQACRRPSRPATARHLQAA